MNKLSVMLNLVILIDSVIINYEFTGISPCDFIPTHVAGLATTAKVEVRPLEHVANS